MNLFEQLGKEGIQYDRINLAPYVDILNRIDGLLIEQEEINDSMCGMSRRMDEQGFDGDFDPLAPQKRRYEEIEILLACYYDQKTKIHEGLNETNMNALEELEELTEIDAELDWERDQERRQMGIY